MKLSLSTDELLTYVIRQLETFFPDGYEPDRKAFRRSFDHSLQRVDYCFGKISLPSFKSEGEVFLNHLHSDQYTMFLWFLSNSVWSYTQDEKTASKIFYLNKVLHSFNCMYDAKLPDVFLLIHVIGMVLGKAEYGNFFVATQGCTVGAHNGKYPVIGKNVSLLPHSSIIGNCVVGDNVSIGISSKVYQEDVEADTIIYTDKNGITVHKKTQKTWGKQFFYK